MKRQSGVLMPLFSLWSPFSVGCFGEEARQFIDFLSDCGFSWWQVLPFVIPDEWNSPYKSFSAFAGNPYFIDLRELNRAGLLTDSELESARQRTPYLCEYDRLKDERLPLLKLAEGRLSPDDRRRVRAFLDANPDTDMLCHFMARRVANGSKPWQEWDVSDEDTDTYALWGFIQYEFIREWSDIRAYAHQKGIRIMGDIPIYVSLDSSDVMYHLTDGIFDVDPDGKPRHVAGCPPDYFAAEGQMWGNPLYNWQKMAADDYGWWRRRLNYTANLFDGIRFDHFRGLESYWSIPADAESARLGHWEEGPRMDFIRAMRDELDRVRRASGNDTLLVAEDLGEYTQSLASFVAESGFPGMRVIQFAFDGKADNIHLPYQYVNNTVAYSGTHDNNTLLGFIWEADDVTRRRMLDYCGFYSDDWNCPESRLAVIHTLFESSAGLVVLPIQDVLGYGADTRINTPGRASGNWAYRITKSQLDSIDRSFYRRLNSATGRI